MAISSSKTLDHWQEVFRTAGESDVFRVIRQGIRVAASDHPDEFRIRKDKIVQMLFAALPRVEKSDEGHRDAVKAMEEEEEEKSGRGNGALLAARTTPPSAEEEPPRAAVPVVVVEEIAETKRQETWKIASVSANGKIRLRRVVDDQTKPSKPQTTFTEHQVPDEPRNDQQEGSSLRSNLEAAKRRLSEGWSWRPFEPRSKKFCRRLEPPMIPPEPSNQEGSLPTFTEHQPPDLVIAPSTQRLTSTEHKPPQPQPQPPVIVVDLPAKRPRLPNMLLDVSLAIEFRFSLNLLASYTTKILGISDGEIPSLFEISDGISPSL